MQYLVGFLLTATLVWAAELQNIPEGSQRSISNQLLNAIEGLKQQLPCGFPKYGIPPLAPLKTAYREINIDTEGIQAFGFVRNFSLFGLDDFDILDLRANVLRSHINFQFNWNNVYFDCDYELSVAKRGRGMKLFGPAQFSLQNFTIWGVIKYNLNVFTGQLRVKDLSLYISLHGVKSDIGGLSKISIVNKKLNRIIEQWFMIIVNDNTNRAAVWSNSILMPVLNDMLSDKTLSDILAAIGGDGVEEPCIPPTDFN